MTTVLTPLDPRLTQGYGEADDPVEYQAPDTSDEDADHARPARINRAVQVDVRTPCANAEEI